MSVAITLNGRNYLGVPTSRAATAEEKALDFFLRAELGEALEMIWDVIKHLPFSTMLKLTKVAALIVAVILLTHSISLTGLLALGGAIAGLLIAAITNILVWLIYIPLYIVRTPDFASSVILAFGLAWLVGVSPFVALMLSPFLIFGFRLLEHSQLAQKQVSEILSDIGDIVEKLNLKASILDKTRIVAGFISNVVPRNRWQLARLSQRI